MKMSDQLKRSVIGFVSPAELAAAWHCSERTLRKIARDIGACHIVGKAMVLTDDDVMLLLEATRPTPRRGPLRHTDRRELIGDYASLVALRKTLMTKAKGAK